MDIFTEINFLFVLGGSILLGAASGVTGCFTVLRKKALAGDVVAHATLPGVALAFLVFREKNLLVLLCGAVITGLLSLWLLDYIKRGSKIKSDSALAIVLSFFFGVGVVLLTRIQHSGIASQSGLDSFLFGKAASMVKDDVLIFGSVCIVVIAVISSFFKEFKMISFDPDFAEASGLPVRTLELVLNFITVLVIASGLQAVGVVLMAALLITPAALARFWTQNLKTMVWIAAMMGAVSAIGGTVISVIEPGMPTGPWIVVVLTIFAFISFLIAPGKGIISRYSRRLKIMTKIREENYLKYLYRREEDAEGSSLREADTGNEKTLKRLEKKGLLTTGGSEPELTVTGRSRAARIVKLHRLWEVYLTTRMQIAPDHVHEDAEAIEHVITPELEARLEALLEYPEVDPHKSRIPYSDNKNT